MAVGTQPRSTWCEKHVSPADLKNALGQNGTYHGIGLHLAGTDNPRGGSRLIAMQPCIMEGDPIVGEHSYYTVQTSSRALARL
jgi:hypothetical protein